MLLLLGIPPKLIFIRSSLLSQKKTTLEYIRGFLSSLNTWNKITKISQAIVENRTHSTDPFLKLGTWGVFFAAAGTCVLRKMRKWPHKTTVLQGLLVLMDLLGMILFLDVTCNYHPVNKTPSFRQPRRPKKAGHQSAPITRTKQLSWKGQNLHFPQCRTFPKKCFDPSPKKYFSFFIFKFSNLISKMTNQTKNRIIGPNLVSKKGPQNFGTQNIEPTKNCQKTCQKHIKPNKNPRLFHVGHRQKYNGDDKRSPVVQHPEDPLQWRWPPCRTATWIWKNCLELVEQIWKHVVHMFLVFFYARKIGWNHIWKTFIKAPIRLCTKEFCWICCLNVF